MQAIGRTALILSLTCSALAGCTPKGSDGVDPNSAADGRSLYEERCVVCHGSTGRGDGPAALNQDPAPSDLTQLAARNNGVFDRDYVMSVIFASPDAFSKSGTAALMPAFSHGDLGDLVIVEENGVGTPVYTDLLALATYLESIQAK